LTHQWKYRTGGEARTASQNGWALIMVKRLRPPQRPSYYPEPAFVAWHVREVFQGEARYSSNVT